MTNILQIYFDNLDYLFKDLYERKIPINDVLEDLNITKNLSFIQTPKMKENDILESFAKFIKRNMNYIIKGIKPTMNDIKYYYKKLIENINNSTRRLSYKQIIELIGNLAFSNTGINCELQNEPKTNREIIECFLMSEVLSFIKNKSIDNDKIISEFIKLNHILFCTDDRFQHICLRYFLILNVFISIKYDKFSNYY